VDDFAAARLAALERLQPGKAIKVNLGATLRRPVDNASPFKVDVYSRT
jgi:hypothetical protein